MTRSNKHTHTQSKTKKIVLIAIAAVLVVIAGGYAYRSTYYQDRFLPNTSIDDIDISNKTVAEANDLLHDRYSKQSFYNQRRQYGLENHQFGSIWFANGFYKRIGRFER